MIRIRISIIIKTSIRLITNISICIKIIIMIRNMSRIRIWIRIRSTSRIRIKVDNRVMIRKLNLRLISGLSTDDPWLVLLSVYTFKLSNKV